MRGLFLMTGAFVAASPCVAKRPFENLVVFGDSYTDNGRLSHYMKNNGSAPPAGTLHVESKKTASGGLAWPQFIARDHKVNLYDYAVSGATCSNKIVDRFFAPINRNFPSVTDDEIPSFKKDIGFSALYSDRTSQNTVYSLWIGTNDLGIGAFLDDKQVPGTNIMDFVDCIWSVFDSLYESGGRRFVLLNQAPLHISPIYAAAVNGGVNASGFFPGKENVDQLMYENKIWQYTTLVNGLFDYGVPFNLVVKKRWPGADFVVFDAHALLTDVYKRPKDFLEAPYNVTGTYRACEVAGLDSPGCKGSTLGSFLWYDELHPSEKADEIIAKYVVEALQSPNAKYGTTYS